MNVRDWLHVSDNCRALDVIIESGDPGRGLQHRRRQPRQERGPDAADPAAARQAGDRSSGTSPDRPGPRPPVFARHDEAAVARLEAARQPSSRGSPRPSPGTSRTSGGGGRSRKTIPAFQAYYQTQYRRPARLSARVAGLPLITGATGFAGSHLVEHLLEREPAVAAWSNPAGTPPRPARSARAVERRRSARSGGRAQRRSPRSSRRSSITAPAPPTSASSWTDPAKPLRVNALGTHHLLDAARRMPVSRAPVVVAGSALVYRPSLDAHRRGLADRPVEPLRRQQAGAGDDRRRGHVALRFSWRGRSITPGRASRRVRHVQLRAADRRDRSRARRRRS